MIDGAGLCWSVVVLVGGGCITHLSDVSAGRCVAVEGEEVGEAVLGVGGVGEHATGAGAAFAAVVVEQHGLSDAVEFVQEFAY